MRNETEISVKTNLPKGTLKTLTLCRWGGKNCCNVAIKTGVDSRSHRRGRTSVSHAAALLLIPRGWHKPVLFYHCYSDCSRTAAAAADEKTDWRRLKSHLILQHLIKGCFRIRCGSAPGLQVTSNRAAFTWVTFDGAFTFNHFKRKKCLSCKRLWQSVPCEPGLHPPLIPACIPLWSYCADRGALPARRRSFIYFTVFHLQTTTNLHQREIHSVYPIGVI